MNNNNENPWSHLLEGSYSQQHSCSFIHSFTADTTGREIIRFESIVPLHYNHLHCAHSRSFHCCDIEGEKERERE